MNKQLRKILILSLLASFELSAQQGLKAEYFNGTELRYKVAERTDADIDLSWDDTPPVKGLDPHNCSIRWTGLLKAPETATYLFSAKVDDGIRVWVGGVQVIDAWDLNDDGRFTGRVKLTKGTQYDLKVEYFNALIEGEVRLLWEIPESKGPFKNPQVVDGQYYAKTLEKPAPKPPVTAAPKPKPPVVTKPKPPVTKKTKPEEKKKPSTTPPAVTKPPVVSVDTIQKHTPKNVNFERGKSVMLHGSFAELDRLATFLLRYPHLKLTIEGHTDIIGDTALNKKLSQERADKVAQYLSEKGIEKSRMEAIGYGDTRPLITGNSKTGHPENRRVVFLIK